MCKELKYFLVDNAKNSNYTCIISLLWFFCVLGTQFEKMICDAPLSIATFVISSMYFSRQYISNFPGSMIALHSLELLVPGSYCRDEVVTFLNSENESLPVVAKGNWKGILNKSNTLAFLITPYTSAKFIIQGRKYCRAIHWLSYAGIPFMAQ